MPRTGMRRRTAMCVLMATSVLVGLIPTALRPTTAGAASDNLVFSTQPGDGSPGVLLAAQPAVTIKDSSSNTVDTSSTITLTLTGPGGAALTGLLPTLTCDQTSGGTTSMAASHGVATFSGCKVSRGGTFTLTASDATDGNISVVSSSFFVSGPAQLAWGTPQTTGGSAGSAWSTQPQVIVEDAHGSTVSASTATISLAIKSGTGTSGAALSCTHLQVTASSGVAAFAGCAIDKTGTGYQLVATDSTDSLISAPGSTFDITAGSPAKLVFTIEPSGGDGGAAFATQPVVAVEDAGNNVIGSNTDSIALSIDSGGTAGATLSCSPSTTKAASSGVATFSGCAIDTTGSGYKLKATDSAHSLNVTSDPFDVVAGGAANISFATPPGGGTGGSAWATQPVVHLTDSGGNPVSGAVQLAIKGGTGTSGASLLCDANPLTAVNGSASFVGCRIDKNGSGYELTATSGSLSVDSSAFDVSIGSPAHATFTVEPSSGTGGSPLPIPEPSVTLTDAGGNHAAGSVTLSITSGTGSPGAALTCSSNTVAAVSGVAAFTGCAVDEIGTGYTLTATVGSVHGYSTAFDVTLGPPAQLALTTEPGGGTGGVAWATQPVVTVEDAGGNQLPGSTSMIALAITAGTGNGKLACASNPLPATRGAAVFSGCRIDTAASAYTLTATDAHDNLSAVSHAFAVTPGPAAKLMFATQPSGAAAGVAFPTQPVVAVADAGGNTVTASSASIALSLTPGTGTGGAALSCTTNPLAATSGRAAFDACSVDTAASGYTFTATDSADGLSAESLPFAVLAPPPQPLGVAPTGVPLAQTFGGDLYGLNPTNRSDAVNSATGSLAFAVPDLKVAGIGRPLMLTRTYNSADTTGGSFGPGWSSLLDIGVRLTKNQQAIVRGEDGQQLVWTYNTATATWMPPPGARASLSCGSKQCTLTRFDGTRWDVNLTAGGQQELVDFLSPDGFGLHFAWGSGRVTVTIGSTLSSPYNVVATLNGAGEVTAISTPKGRSLTYTYDSGGRLVSLRDVRGSTWTYTYGSGRLTTMTDPLGHVRLTATYDSGGRVTAVSQKGGPRHTSDTFTWDAGTQTATRSALANAGGSTVSEAYADVYSGNVLVSQTTPWGGISRYSYDAQLNLTESQDPMGWVTTFAYDGANNLVTESTPITATQSMTVHATYDPSHRITTQTDADGNLTTYVYNGPHLGFIRPPAPTPGTSVTPGTVFTYNKQGELVEVDNPVGKQLYSYDALGNQTGAILQNLSGVSLNGKGTQVTYDEAGDALTRIDPRGTSGGSASAFKTTRTYDGAGDLLTTTVPGGGTTTTTFDAAGDVSSTTDALGRVTSYAWDEASLTRTTTNPGGGTATQTYDPSGDLLLESSAGGRTTTHVFDNAGREIQATGPDNITTDYTYDLEGNVVRVGDTTGQVTTREFDSLNRLIREVDNGAVTLLSHDPAGNVTAVTDPTGAGTSYTYNEHNRVTSVTNPAGTTSYGYDAADDVVSRTDGNGHTTTFTYDGAGRRASATLAGNTTTYGYDLAGNPNRTTDADGRTTTSTYDALNRVTQTVYAQSGRPTITVGQSYDVLGRRTGMTDPTGTHAYVYDAAGNLVSASSGSDVFHYDWTSHPGSIVETYPDGSSISYAVDDASNLMSVSTGTQGSPGYLKVSYVRNALRQTTAIADSNGVLETRHVDTAGNVLDQTLQVGATTLAHATFSYDIGHNRLSQVDDVAGSATTSRYGYDATGRITGFTSTSAASTATTGTPASTLTPGSPGAQTGAPPPPPSNDPTPFSAGTPSSLTPTFAYDHVGNQLSAGGTSYSYDAADRVTSQTDGSGTTTWTYDRNGDVTGISGPHGTQTFTYDAADRLASATTGGATVTYTYDGDGNRASKTKGAAVTQYVWDTAGPYPRLAIERTGGGTLIRRYLYGDGPVAVQTPTATYFYHLDPQGSVAALTDQSGAVVAAYHYDAYGNVTTEGSSPPANPLLFQGQFLDSDTGLYDMRARSYDTSTGRFTQRDPVATPDGVPVMSPYVFVNDRPTVLTDPTGRTVTATSIFWGKDTLASNIGTDVNYGVTTIKLGYKAAVKISKYLADRAAAEATSAEEELSADMGALAEDTSISELEAPLEGFGDEAAVEASGSALADGGDAAKFAGPALAVIGIGLQAFITVEDCMHGPVARCVGDAVGLAVNIGFTVGCAVATEGTAASVCAVAGAILGAALQEVITLYGPQIADFAAKQYEDIAAAVSDAWPGVKASIFDYSDQVASFATQTWGTVATGFNSAIASISSGFNSAIGTLVDAGYKAADLAVALADAFAADAKAALASLVDFGYQVGDIAQAIFDTFNTTAQEAAQLLKDGFNYTVDQIAGVLKDVYNLGDQAAAQILEGVNFAVDEIGSALHNVYNDAAATVGTVLQNLSYGVQQIGAVLQNVFAETDQEVAAALHTLGYTATQVANTLVNLYDDADQAVASALNFATYTANQIAGVLKDVFSDPTQLAANLLKGLNYGIDVIAGALDSVYTALDQKAAQILENIGFGVTAVATALHDVYNDIDTAVAGILKNIGNTVDEIGSALESAFTEGAQAVATALKYVNFAVDQVATALQDVFNEGAAAAATVLKDIGYAAGEVATALQDVFSEAAQAAAQILDDIGYTVNEIAGALETVFGEAAEACASILKAIGIDPTAIATALEDVYNEAASAVASILKDIGEAAADIANVLENVFNEATSDVANLLSSIGFDSNTIDAIGGAFASFGQSVEDCFSSFFSDC